MKIEKKALIEHITGLFHNSTLSLQTTGVDFSESKLTLKTVFVKKDNEDTVTTYEILNTIAEEGTTKLIETIVNDMVHIEDAEEDVEEVGSTEDTEEVED